MGYKTVFSPSDLANLSQVLRFNQPLHAYQAVAAAAVVASRIVDVPSVVRDVHIKIDDAGSSGKTDVMVGVIRKGDTTEVELLNDPLTIDDSESNGFEVSATEVGESGMTLIADEILLEPGDVLFIEVTDAPGSSSGLGLHITVNVDQRVDDLEARALNIGGSVG